MFLGRGLWPPCDPSTHLSTPDQFLTNPSAPEPSNPNQANNFLWPFKLSSPKGGYKKKLNHFIEGGDAGQRAEKINQLIKSVL